MKTHRIILQLEILETLLSRPPLDESTFLSLPQPSVGLGAIVPPKQSSLNERPTSCFCVLLSWVPSLMCHRCSSHPQPHPMFVRVCVHMHMRARSLIPAHLCAFAFKTAIDMNEKKLADGSSRVCDGAKSISRRRSKRSLGHDTSRTDTHIHIVKIQMAVILKLI